MNFIYRTAALVATLFLSINPHLVSAQELLPYRVKDINIQDAPSNSSFAKSFVGVDGTAYFLATDGVRGFEIWKTDGSEAGTDILKDINTTPGQSGASDRLASLGSSLVFMADDDSGSGQELWKSDGTELGTMMISSIRPGTSNPQVNLMTVIGDKLFFRANNGSKGSELWLYDSSIVPSVDNPTLVKDILVGASSSLPEHLTNLNGTLFFAAHNGTTLGVWKSDGTELGTQMVGDIRPDAGINKVGFVAMGNNIFFVADDLDDNRFQLWKTDGTDEGTQLVKDTNPAGFDNPGEFTVIGNTLFFQAVGAGDGLELWKTDGTEAGTSRVKDIISGAGSSTPKFLTAVGNTLFFKANDGVNGEELWKSDGTDVGTVLVKDINAGPNDSGISWMTAYAGKLYFTAREPNSLNELELWSSDGTAEGTQKVMDINPGPDGSNPQDLTAVGDFLYFSADDGVNGRELWAIGEQNTPSDCSFVVIKTAAGGAVSCL